MRVHVRVQREEADYNYNSYVYGPGLRRACKWANITTPTQKCCVPPVKVSDGSGNGAVATSYI